MNLNQNAVQNVVSYVLDRLASGLYPPGGRLLTSREMAEELGVHRNTVAKAYKSLVDLGVISSTPGRGTFAAARLDLDNRRLHAQQIDVRLAPVLLDALAADAAGIVSNFDVVFTSLFHLLEVRELLAAAKPRRRIIGIHTQPDERGLAEIAQIEPDAHVGIVVSNSDGARRFRAQLQTFTEAALQVLIQPTDDDVKNLAREVDLIVTSRSRAD